MKIEKAFEHKCASQLDDKERENPELAFVGLFSFASLEECQRMAWTMLKYTMAADSYMETTERQLLVCYYEIMYDVLEAVFKVHKVPGKKY
jgi:hypothetical protein